MHKRLCVSASLIVLLSLSLILIPFATAQARKLTTSEIQFDASTRGECIVSNRIVDNQPNILGFGIGEAKIKGIAENVDPDYQNLVAYSDEIDATGGISVSWTENEVKHRLNVRIYSTETTEGYFFPCEERFLIPFLEFRATNETTTFSGKALFSSGSSGIYGQILGQEFQGMIVVQLFDMNLNFQYSIAWSCMPLPISSTPLAAAEAYKSNVQTGEEIVLSLIHI